MNLRFTEAEEAFRQEVRDFLARELPEDIRAAAATGHMPSKSMMQRWTRILLARGWSVPLWPVQYGGPNWTSVQRYLFDEEIQRAPAPPPLPFGANMVGPVIYTFGTEAQKERFLPRIASLDDWWCQGFSEPEAGSDLASLRTRATREGDHYLVNGQKTWTSYAHHADWIFVLVRTDPLAKKQAGISFLLIDMKTPGITVRPIITIEGGHEVNEVFFDNVLVPIENLVGQENRGWDCAKFLLGNERVSIARVGTSKERIRRIKAIAAAETDGGRSMLDMPGFREKLTAVEVELMALEITQLRVLAADSGRGGAKPDPASSILKIKGSEIQQATTELMMQVAGPWALPFADAAADAGARGVAAEPRTHAIGADATRDPTASLQDSDSVQAPDWAWLVAPTYFNWRKVSIYGGSNEIQKTIIAKAVLGL